MRKARLHSVLAGMLRHVDRAAYQPDTVTFGERFLGFRGGGVPGTVGEEDQRSSRFFASHKNDWLGW